MTVVPHPLGASLQLLQPHPQLSLLPAQTALHLLRTLILLLQLLKLKKKRQKSEQGTKYVDPTLDGLSIY